MSHFISRVNTITVGESKIKERLITAVNQQISTCVHLHLRFVDISGNDLTIQMQLSPDPDTPTSSSSPVFSSCAEISQETAVNPVDIVSTLQSLQMLKYWKGKHLVLKRQVGNKTIRFKSEFNLYYPVLMVMDW